MGSGTTEGIIILGLIINFLGTLFAIFRSQLKTENRITRVETLMSILVRETMPKDFHLRSGDKDAVGIGP
jgi:hypothetical protein